MPGAIIPTIPSNWRSWQLCLPDDVAWRALGTGLVRLFCYRYYWDKTSGDVDAVTAKGQEILSRWLANECEGDPVCQLISDAIDAALNGNNPDLFFTTILDYVNEHCLSSIFDAFSEFVESYLCFQLTHLFGSEAQLSEVISLFGLCGVSIVGYISGVRVNNCVLQYQLNGSSAWNDASSLEACIKSVMQNNPSQPGQIPDNYDPPPGTCFEFMVTVPANGQALAPMFIAGGMSVEVLDVQGAWTHDSQMFQWWCPDGKEFVLGGCSGDSDADGSFPLPSGKKYELIMGGSTPVWHTVRKGSIFTFIDEGNAIFQMNDTDLSNNTGSVTAKIRICAPECGLPSDIVHFNAANSVTWIDDYTAEVDSDGYIESDRSSITYSVDEDCWIALEDAVLLTGTDATNINVAVCPDGHLEAGAADNIMDWFSTHEKKHSAASHRHETGDHNDFSYRFYFVTATC